MTTTEMIVVAAAFDGAIALVCWWYVWMLKRVLAEDLRRHAGVWDRHTHELSEIYRRHA